MKLNRGKTIILSLILGGALARLAHAEPSVTTRKVIMRCDVQGGLLVTP